MVEKHRITQLYTAPTAIRALMRFGDEPVRKHDRSSLRILGEGHFMYTTDGVLLCRICHVV